MIFTDAPLKSVRPRQVVRRLALHIRVTTRDMSPRLAIRTGKSDRCIESLPKRGRGRRGGRGIGIQRGIGREREIERGIGRGIGIGIGERRRLGALGKIKVQTPPFKTRDEMCILFY